MTSERQVEMIGPSEMYFSYGQFMVYDRSERSPGSLWTEAHVAQGFIRRPYSIGFGTILEYGRASVRIFLRELTDLDTYERIVRVPIELRTGVMQIDGPEEHPTRRSVQLDAGHYQICVAQRVIDSDSEAIDIFIVPCNSAANQSQIVLADSHLTLLHELVETGDVAL